MSEAKIEGIDGWVVYDDSNPGQTRSLYLYDSLGGSIYYRVDWQSAASIREAIDNPPNSVSAGERAMMAVTRAGAEYQLVGYDAFFPGRKTIVRLAAVAVRELYDLLYYSEEQVEQAQQDELKISQRMADWEASYKKRHSEPTSWPAIEVVIVLVLIAVVSAAMIAILMGGG